MGIRTALPEDIYDIFKVEEESFPPAEQADMESLKQRLEIYPDHFWVMEDDGRIVSYVNGMVTDAAELRDEMYKNAELHDENGSWQMIFGVCTLPGYRGRGCAGKLLRHVIDTARRDGRKGLVRSHARNGLSGSTHLSALLMRGYRTLHTAARSGIRCACNFRQNQTGVASAQPLFSCVNSLIISYYIQRVLKKISKCGKINITIIFGGCMLYETIYG